MLLEQARAANGWASYQWATKAQADKLQRPLVPNAAGVVVVLNERQFTVYNAAQMASAAPAPAAPLPTQATPLPAETGSAKVLTFKAAPEKTARVSFQTFRDALPNRAAGWPREARAFYDGLPNGGTYQAHMGTERGEFLYCAMQYLAEHGDAEGRRYTLELEQVGWVIYTATDKKGLPLKRPEIKHVFGLEVEQKQTEALQAMKEQGLAQPTYRMHLKPATQSKAA